MVHYHKLFPSKPSETTALTLSHCWTQLATTVSGLKDSQDAGDFVSHIARGTDYGFALQLNTTEGLVIRECLLAMISAMIGYSM